jgi:rod shape-determining protein MreC
MKRLLRFLVHYRNGVLFLTLEVISLFLIFSHQPPKFLHQLNSSSTWMGNIYAYLADIKSYPLLKKAYQELLNENSLLRDQLVQKEIESKETPDNYPKKPPHFIPARVVNNSIIHTKNYLTIDKGSHDGITSGMGVITTQGIVGRIKAVSEQFATITSLLHVDMLVSVKVGNAGVIGTVRWLGTNPTQAQLLYVPRHITIEPGDSVVTSGYNATFYEGILIGRVKQVELKKEALFYHITVDLSTDFSALQYVYVVNHQVAPEKESLEKLTKSYYE